MRRLLVLAVLSSCGGCAWEPSPSASPVHFAGTTTAPPTDDHGGSLRAPNAVASTHAVAESPADASPPLDGVLRQGMTTAQVSAMLGMPSQRLDLLGSWFYGDTELQFQDGRLVAVANPGALAVEPPANPDLELREGMSKAEISGALGMPTHRMDTIGVWYYGDSELTFVGDGLVAVANAGNLRVAGPRGARAEGVRTEHVPAATGGPRSASQRPVPVSARSSAQPRPGRAASGGTGAGSQPTCAENGDLYNVDNDGDGRSEPIHVRGYFRKDGTYVRGHYRARARK